MLRWLISYWCNYACRYCPQDHGRDTKYGENAAHAFDNQPIEIWLDAFARHFSERNLVMTITGGEPMLDRRSMPVLLKKLTSCENVRIIRIDTNASWNPKFYSEVDKSKIRLMCTFHPGQTSEEAFAASIERLQHSGFVIGMINYVMTRESIPEYERQQRRFVRLGIPVNPNPLWDSNGQYASEDLDLMREYLPSDFDYEFRTQQRSPKGQRCRFPAIAYELNPWGMIWVGCHYNHRGSFFAKQLPRRFRRSAVCPHASCVCLDKYSFVSDSDRNTNTNTLDAYGRLLLEKQKGDQVVSLDASQRA